MFFQMLFGKHFPNVFPNAFWSHAHFSFITCEVDIFILPILQVRKQGTREEVPKTKQLINDGTRNPAQASDSIF